MWLAAVRDIAIVLLAIESLIIGVLLVLVLMQLRKLVQILREEVQPIIESANDTATTVQGTAHFLSHHLVDPLIRIKSYAAGTREAVSNIARMRARRRRRMRQ
jgi:hypothetical protein